VLKSYRAEFDIRVVLFEDHAVIIVSMWVDDLRIPHDSVGRRRREAATTCGLGGGAATSRLRDCGYPAPAPRAASWRRFWRASFRSELPGFGWLAPILSRQIAVRALACARNYSFFSGVFNESPSATYAAITETTANLVAQLSELEQLREQVRKALLSTKRAPRLKRRNGTGTIPRASLK
jgi:hypothetical protein